MIRMTRRELLPAVLLGLSTGRTCADDPLGIVPAAAEALRQGLTFLAATQNKDGSFGDTADYEGNVAVTAMVGLAFLAGGHSSGNGPYRAVVSRLLDYLLKSERTEPSGYLNLFGPKGKGGMYNHGLATLCLAEARGTTHEEALEGRIRATLGRAVALLLRSRHADGGWRYEPEPMPGDISLTACQMSALRAARASGFRVPKAVAEGTIAFATACRTVSGEFVYQPRSTVGGIGCTAAGVSALQSAGVYRGKLIEPALKRLSEWRPHTQAGRREIDEPSYWWYAVYVSASALWIGGERYWGEWFASVQEELLSEGRYQGNGRWIDRAVCKHYATAIACFVLQLPLGRLSSFER